MLTADDQRVLVGHFHQVIDAIEATSTTGDGRWPLLRTGDREPIPGIVRRLVYARDNRRCVDCGWQWSLQLDHIVPWSAYGTDRSDNLRTLCRDCNEHRSNYLEAYLPRVVPVTVVCDPCLRNHDDVADRHDRFTYWQHCPICLGEDFDFFGGHRSAWCGSCTAVSWVSDEARLM